MINIQLAEVGDTIVEGSDRIKVERVELNACSKKGVHINNRFCYDNTEMVDLRPGERKDDLEELAAAVVIL